MALQTTKQSDLKYLTKHSTGIKYWRKRTEQTQSSYINRPSVQILNSVAVFKRILTTIIIGNSLSHLDVESAGLWAPLDHRDEQNRECSDPAAPSVSNKQTQMHQFEEGKPASSILNVQLMKIFGRRWDFAVTLNRYGSTVFSRMVHFSRLALYAVIMTLTCLTDQPDLRTEVRTDLQDCGLLSVLLKLLKIGPLQSQRLTVKALIKLNM